MCKLALVTKAVIWLIFEVKPLQLHNILKVSNDYGDSL